jgi:cupin 2 domain-containing protein
MGARVLRIVSHAHASPPGFWYDQPEAEWVVVVAGSAGLLVEGESAVRGLGPGDYVLIPPHVRHRVEWTAPAISQPSGSQYTCRKVLTRPCTPC